MGNNTVLWIFLLIVFILFASTSVFFYGFRPAAGPLPRIVYPASISPFPSQNTLQQGSFNITATTSATSTITP